MTVPFEKLAELCHRKRPTHVRKWCESLGIHYMLDADHRPWTTESKLNEAMERGRKTEPNFKWNP